tara:strand:- start:1896 stop:3254 length:1359 start_codon:yes stop_codon:yes gene_type:complete
MSELKQMPSNVDAERAVISCMIQFPEETMPDAKAQLTPEHFYNPAFRCVFEVLIDLDDERADSQFNLIVIHTEMVNRGLSEKTGGMGTLADLMDDAPSASVFSKYLSFVETEWKKRSALKISAEATSLAYDATTPDEIDGVLKDLGTGCDNIIISTSSESFTEIKPALNRTFETINERAEAGGKIPGISTGIHELDQLTNGYQAAQQWVIGARPSVGKSAMILTLARHLLKAGVPVGIFSAEMTEEQMLMRMLAAEGGIDSLALARGSLNKQTLPKLTRAFQSSMNWPLFISEKRGITSAEIVRQARQMVKKHGVKVIFIDYLQKIKATGKHDRRDLEVSAVSNDLFNAAGDLGITTVVAAQLGRLPKGTKNHRPGMGDLRESGSIEQDADVIALLHRLEDVDEEDTPQAGPHANPIAEVDMIIDKCRNGSTGVVPFDFVKPTTSFEIRENR